MNGALCHVWGRKIHTWILWGKLEIKGDEKYKHGFCGKNLKEKGDEKYIHGFYGENLKERGTKNTYIQGFFGKNVKERKHLEDVGVDGRILLKCISHK
jgi:hypothetical protein